MCKCHRPTHTETHTHSFNLSGKRWTSSANFLQISHQFAIISGIQLKPSSTLNPCLAVYIYNMGRKLVSETYQFSGENEENTFLEAKKKKHFTNVSLFNRLDSRPARRFWVKGLSAHFLWDQSFVSAFGRRAPMESRSSLCKRVKKQGSVKRHKKTLKS